MGNQPSKYQLRYVLCPRCKGQNHPQAKWCQFCGLQFDFSPQPQPSKNEIPSDNLSSIVKPEEKRKKKSGCITILLWVFFFPIMFSIFAYRKKKTYLYIIATAIWLVYGIGFTANNAVKSSPEYKAGRTATAIYKAIYAKYTEAAKPTETPKPTPTKDIDSSIKAIMEGAGIDEIFAIKALEAIRSVGFEKVYKLEYIMDYDMLKAYSADVGYTKKYNVTFIDNEVFGISSPSGTVFYDRDAGGAIDNILNYIFTEEDKSSFAYVTEQNVKASLKSPSTAKFPSLVWNPGDWQFARKKDLVQVKSWVDSQNSFGAMIRSEIYAEYSYETTKLSCLVVGGQLTYGVCSEIR